MQRSQFAEEQIKRILRKPKAVSKTADLCREPGISDATFYEWRSRLAELHPTRLAAASASLVRREIASRSDSAISP